MTIKSAEPHTIAPRLGYLEDKVDYLASRPGSGEGGTDPSPLLAKLWKATLFGASTGAIPADTPWTADQIYDALTTGSMHMTVFGAIYGAQNAVACQDGYGFYGKIFHEGEQRWSPSAADFSPFADDVFGPTRGPPIETFREQHMSLSEAVWGNGPELWDFSTSIAAQAAATLDQLQRLATDLQRLADRVDSEVQRLDSRISSIT